MLLRGKGVDPRLVVVGAAVLAVALRFPGLLYPIGPDEAGYTLVARAWDPFSGELYGRYWVDRPPTLVALFKLSDLLGGPFLLRMVAAVGCGVLVVASAAAARQALRFTGLTDERTVGRTGAWTALLTAAFTSNAMIDPIMAKGEVLGIPFVVASCWLVLRAMNRGRDAGRGARRAALLTVSLAGASGSLATGMKQNLVAGLLFGTVLLVASRVTGRLTTDRLVGLLAGFAAGAAVPVAGTLVWAVTTGVGLEDLGYAVYGFRTDALEVLLAGSRDAPLERAALLAGILVATGMAFVVAGLVIHRRRVWRLDPALATATGVILAVDLAGLLLGGSFWRPYLFVLVPDLVLCAALLLAVRVHVARRTRALIVAAAATSAASSLAWAALFGLGVGPAHEVASGRALAEAARGHDTIVVYGGRADVVLASGLASPYPHLWSLPMRTLDPELTQLENLLTGPRAPTWVVMIAPGHSWDGLADHVRAALEARYDVHGRVCDGRYVWLRADLDRPPLSPACDLGWGDGPVRATP